MTSPTTTASPVDPNSVVDPERLRALEAQYDSERQTRQVTTGTRWFTYLFLIGFGIYHYITAGFGLPIDHWHMGIHLGGVLFLVFLLYPMRKIDIGAKTDVEAGRFRLGGIHISDWILGIVGAFTALYIGFTWEGVDLNLFGYRLKLSDQAMRQGNPAQLDVIAGTILIILVLEATRRTIGWTMPIIILFFIAYALWGQSMPFNILKHPGVTWNQFINNIYFPAEGIFGVTLWVVATVVFHFVLFGTVAHRMGLGQLFVDLSTILAGRFTGGPAKVCVASSAMFGMISGSSVANAVSTGTLTIPNMKRLGYPGHFAGGVEAAASAGGQVTPPIMGAAAFIMAEFLGMKYSDIALAATVPAAMHYIGVIAMVHFEAKRLGLRTFTKEEIPNLLDVLKRGWLTVVPLIVLLYVLFSGYTPYMAAFWGITACIVIGLLNPYHRMSVRQLADAFYEGGRNALAVGAISAAVGIVVGVITLSGLAFTLGFKVTSGALQLAQSVHAAFTWLPIELFTVKDAALFLSMVFIALACILLGSGVPTTALYIMLATVAQPAFKELGVPPLAAHMFVFYYGIIAEITPPVCSTAFAAAAIAGANPWTTGNTAFKLSNAKIMVPFVFCYSPAMLIVLPEYFTWAAFLQTTLTCALGTTILGAALIGYGLAPMPMLYRVLLGAAGIMMIAPGNVTDIIALIFMIPPAIQQFTAWRALTADAPTPA
jgi:TRAP transporter 4TM/12TM fusion protein